MRPTAFRAMLKNWPAPSRLAEGAATRCRRAKTIRKEWRRDIPWEGHMGNLITPEELPKWVPGELTLDSAPLAWEGLRIRGYRYAGSDVPVPALHDYMVVVYKEGATPMHRRCDGGWLA